LIRRLPAAAIVNDDYLASQAPLHRFPDSAAESV
jgi:hypothetical protein